MTKRQLLALILPLYVVAIIGFAANMWLLYQISLRAG